MWRRCIRRDARHHAGSSSGARCSGASTGASAESLKGMVAYVP